MSWRIGATCVAIKWKVLRVDKKLKGELTPFLKYPSKKLSERFKASEVVFKRRNGDHPFRILGLYGAGRNIEVSCVQSKHNLSTTSLAHINSTTCYNVQVREKYLRLIIVWSGFSDNNLCFSPPCYFCLCAFLDPDFLSRVTRCFFILGVLHLTWEKRMIGMIVSNIAKGATESYNGFSN